MIYIATPTAGTPRGEYVMSLLRASQELRTASIKHALGLVIGVSPIQLARYEAISMFVANEEATHLMFIDDDMTFTAADIMQLRLAEKPIVAAMCPRKAVDLGYNVTPSTNPVTDGDLVSVDEVGSGFMMIERGVIEGMIKTTKQVEVATGVKRWPLFEGGVNAKGEYLSEDYMFCEKARAAGFSVWAHTKLDIGHVGTHVFTSRHTATQKVALLQGGWSE